MPCFLKKFLSGKVLNFPSLGGRLARCRKVTKFCFFLVRSVRVGMPETMSGLLRLGGQNILKVGIGVAGMVV